MRILRGNLKLLKCVQPLLEGLCSLILRKLCKHFGDLELFEKKIKGMTILSLKSIFCYAITYLIFGDFSSLAISSNNFKVTLIESIPVKRELDFEKEQVTFTCETF